MNKPSKFLGSKIKEGAPVSVQGLVKAINEMAKALENLEVRSTKKSRLEWNNGYPVIYIDET